MVRNDFGGIKMTRIFNISGKWNNDFTTEVFYKQNIWKGKLIVTDSGQARGLINFPYRKFGKQRYVEGIFEDSILEFMQYSLKAPEAIISYKCVKKGDEFVGFVEKDAEENNITGRCSILMQELVDFPTESLKGFESTMDIYHRRCVGDEPLTSENIPEDLLILSHTYLSPAED